MPVRVQLQRMPHRRCEGHDVGMPELILESVSKSYPRPRGGSVQALNAFSLTVGDGELLSVMGPSGCGKTTLLRLLAGLESPDSGNIFIGGRNVEQLGPVERDVALVFQNHALYPHMTVRKNIEFGLEARRLAAREISHRTAEVTAILGLEGLLDCMPGELAGGQRQRVALARACARKPGILLLDEPFSNLDPRTRRTARVFLASLWRELRFTMIFVTHDQSDAMAMGRRVLVMEEGRCRQAGTPMGIYDAPANPFVAGFTGSPPMNLFRGIVRSGGAEARLEFVETGTPGQKPHRALQPFQVPLEGWPSVPLLPGSSESLILGMRPEHLAMGTMEDSGMSGAGVWIEHVEYLGAETVIHFETAFHRGAARVSGGTRVVEAGKRGSLRWIKPEGVRWFDSSSFVAQ